MPTIRNATISDTSEDKRRNLSEQQSTQNKKDDTDTNEAANNRPETIPQRYRKDPLGKKQKGRKSDGNSIYGKTRRRIRRSRRYRKFLKKNLPIGEISSSSKKLRVTRAAFMTIYASLWGYTMQFLFGLISFVGYAAERAGEEFVWGLFKNVIPGSEVFYTAYMVTVFIALCLLLMSVAMLTIRRVKWFDVAGIISLASAFAFSFTPFFNILPVAPLWVLFVWYAQITKK